MAASAVAGILVCRALLRLSVKQTILIAGGTAICGASAIAAIAPAIEADGEETGLALGVITLFGLAITAGPILALDLPPVALAIFACLALLFAAYGVQTWLRLQTRIEVTPGTIEATPFGARLAWRELTRVRLAYFSVRRDRGEGWMELKLEAGPKRLRVDSRLDGFDEIARRSAIAARVASLPLDSSTVQNFRALGVAQAPVVSDPEGLVGDR